MVEYGTFLLWDIALLGKKILAFFVLFCFVSVALTVSMGITGLVIAYPMECIYLYSAGIR